MRKVFLLLATNLIALVSYASDQYVYPGGLNHPIQYWQYPDNATMVNDYGFFYQDIGKIAYEKDNNSYWYLVGTAPVWQWLGGYPIGFAGGQIIANASIGVGVTTLPGSGYVDVSNGYKINNVTGQGKIMRGASGGNSAYVSPVSSQSTPANPTGTTSTTGVMMGLAGSITTSATTSGSVLITISGSITNNTVSDGAKVQIRHGTGSAPSNGAALTGTADGNTPRMVNTSAIAGQITAPFSCNAVVTGLSANTAYWIDLSLAAITAGTATVTDISISAIEL